MRSMQFGINWIWYYTDTEEEALTYYVELMGRKPKYDDEISYDSTGKRWAFRLHKGEH